MQHLHFHWTLVGCLQFLCLIAAMTANVVLLIRSKDLSKQPRRMRFSTRRRNLQYLQYMFLAWAGVGVCELLAPKDTFHLKFYGVFCFCLLGLVALSGYRSQRTPNRTRPDPDSMLDLQ
jgi:hypothetical protein